MSFVKCSLHGVEVWAEEQIFDGQDGPLAMPDHIDEDGELRLDAVCEDSYAHVFHPDILRYQEKIGTVDDLVREL